MRISPTKKISIILFPILALILIITIILSNTKTNFFSKASAGDIPKNIKITNITDDSITVSYVTDGRVIGTVLFGTNENNLDTISLDDRDQLNQTIEKYNAHQITLRGLNPNTNYYFSINSGDKNYLNNNQLFTAMTGSKISINPPSQNPAVGNIMLENNTSPAEGIIYLKVNDSQELSALIKNGNYIIPLNSLRNKNLNDYFLLNENMIIKLEAFADEQGSNETIDVSYISPVDTFKLSKNYISKNSEFNPTVNTKNNISPTPTDVKENQSIINSFNFFKLLQSGR